MRALLAVVFGGAVMLAGGGAAWADAFTVGGVTVDVRAASAAKAREQALRQGQVEAYRRLLAVVVIDADRARLPELGADAVESLVSDFSVSDEKASSTRYIASLTVHFDPERVAAFLRANGVAMVRGSDETVVLLGVYRAAPGEPPQLWEETNPWRPLLAQTAVSRGLFPVAVPLGDLLDAEQVPTEKALALDVDAMDALLARYGADAVIVALAEIKPGEGAHLILKRYPRPLPAALSELSSPIADDPAAALGDLAAHAVLAVARGGKPPVSGTMVGETDSLAILVPVASLADWVRVDRTLRALPGVKAVILRAARIDVVQAALQYTGDAEALRAAIARVGFSVAVRDGYWEVTPAPEPATPPLQ
ncbi:DUF2066 domain-containing protein [Oleispirillum naphthae]|uniref:DUF2066 domain-containing protein n=1 Tax=Oleispirillum naphthae TaxID=2838853 RepID=UPI0030824143